MLPYLDDKNQDDDVDSQNHDEDAKSLQRDVIEANDSKFNKTFPHLTKLTVRNLTLEPRKMMPREKQCPIALSDLIRGRIIFLEQRKNL